MLGELTPCGGGRPVPLFLPRVIVGRSPDCDITIPARSVSSRHCELRYDGRQWQLRDIGSRNGTAVNGMRCQESALLPGDVISFARERYTIRYKLTGKPPVASEATVSPRAASGPRESLPATSLTPSNSKSAQFGRLVPCGGGDPIPLLKPVLIVGRRSHCDVQLRFSTVSAEHCRLEFKQGYWFVEELKSTNGIKVDGVRCKSNWLMPQSVLSISNHRYQIVYEPSGDAPPPEIDPFAISLLEKAGLAKQGDVRSTAKWARDDDDQPKSKRWTLDENE